MESERQPDEAIDPETPIPMPAGEQVVEADEPTAVPAQPAQNPQAPTMR